MAAFSKTIFGDCAISHVLTFICLGVIGLYK